MPLWDDRGIHISLTTIIGGGFIALILACLTTLLLAGNFVPGAPEKQKPLPFELDRKWLTKRFVLGIVVVIGIEVMYSLLKA
jgi:hypothetical protein